MKIEDIMQMNEILKPYQEKTKDIDSDNIKDQCNTIEVSISIRSI